MLSLTMRCLLTTLCVLTPSLLLADDATELAKNLPRDANTLAVIRVAEIFGTSRAQSEHWYDRQGERFLSGTAAIPPWVETLVVGSLVHPSMPEEVWSAAVVRRPETMTIAAIAEQEGTAVEELAGLAAVRSRRDSYIIQPSPDLLTAYRPAHRLEASRWARSISEGTTSAISPYLLEAAGRDGHVLLAMDLQDLLDERRVEQLLMDDERFAPNRQLVERLIPLLAGLRGVTLAVTIGEVTQAAVTIEFSADVGPSSLTVKTLFVSILDDLGAAVDEFADSQASSEGTSAVLRCQLSDESLRRILSLIVTPSTPYRAPPRAAAVGTRPSSTRAADPVKATQRYFEAVNKFLDDLQRANRRANDYARTAAWHDNFARKILDLPTEDVDQDVLAYGQSIASRLRALAASLRGQGVEVNAQQQTLTYDVDYDPGWAALSVWGGVGYREPSYHVTSNLREVREQQAAAIAQGAQDREQIWQMIEDERAQLAAKIPTGRGR